ncbi:MAG: hypothetical protein LM598_03955, partial [Candidatus Verstraetearchaeota archaeon]|nr:hypothetical protein [Candidatus Verstraetearchaeota archaeon]
IKVGSTNIRVSEPVPHGTDSRLGYVVMVAVCDGEEKVLYTSDVEGPSLESQLEVILRERASTLIIDGPMTYMLGYRYSYESLERSINNLIRIVRETPVRVMILEHHLLRDLDYKRKIEPVIREAEAKGVRLLSAAEFEGKPVEMLEARRRELYALDKKLDGAGPLSG